MKSILKTGFSFLFVLAFTKGFSQGTDDRTLFALVQQHASRMGLSAEQAQNCTISSSFSDEKTGNTYVYLQQRIHHTRVFNHIKTVIFRGDLLLYHSGQFYGEPVGEVVPQVSATAAVIAAAGHLGLSAPEGLRVAEDRMQVEQKIILSEAGIARQPITAELFWVVTSTGTARLAWNINIDVLGSDDWWNVRVDVLTREVLEQDN
ncbi:MAG TPA: hypothetical protein VFZ78_11100, partial [Flavisolibacter sp.]